MSDAQLCRFIKDAADYGVDVLLNPEPEDDHPYRYDLPSDEADAIMDQHFLEKGAAIAAAVAAGLKPQVDPLVEAGLARLSALYHNKARWQSLKSTREAPKKIKPHNLYKYYTPPHLHNKGYVH